MTKVYVIITHNDNVVVKHEGIVEKEGDVGNIVEAAYAMFRSQYPNRSLFEDGVITRITGTPPG